MTVLYVPGTPGTTIYAGRPSPEVLLTTLSFVNTSGSEQATGFVSPMFGLPLKQGDVPSGTYPKFETTGGAACPATLWGITTWPDGSMKFCAGMIRVPSTVAGSGTLTINVKSGGAAPAASSRSTSDFTAADLSVVLTGVTNLSGDWTASLNTAITDATDIVVIGDGPAGKVWRIGGPLKQSGAAHGQLHCWHYVAALQDGSGNLMGLRYLGRVAQPWADVTSPAVAKRVMTAVVKRGATTIRQLQGVQSDGTTVGNNITLPHYTDFFTCAADARWDFVQGGGSASADCTIRVAHDKTYFVKSRLVPPYDLALDPTSSSSVDYSAQCKGHHEVYNMGNTGERTEIGVLPGWVARHVMKQSSVDERAVRVNALASGGWRNALRRSTTNQVIPCVDVSATYSGLGTVQTTWRYWSSGVAVGVNARPETHLWESEYEPSHRSASTYYAYLISGEPQFCDLLIEQAANLILSTPPGGNTYKTGSPVDAGKSFTGSWSGERNPIIASTTYKGAGLFFTPNVVRVQAWQTRDVAQAAAIYPDTCPSGTEVRKYLREVLTNAYTAINAYNNALPQSWRDGGLVSFTDNGANDTFYENPWAHGYLSNSVCHQASILPGIGADTFRSHVGRFWSSLHAISDAACFAAYRMSQWKGDNNRIEAASDVLFDIAYDAGNPTVQGQLTSSTSTSQFTKTGGWVVTNGDVFAFSTQLDANKPFSAATDNTRLYAVNCSGNTFQLAATPGGAAITVTSSVTINRWLCRLADAGTLWSFEGFSGPQTYVANIYGAIRHHAACGDSVASVRAAQDANLSASGTSFVSQPKNAMATTYPS